MRHTLLYLLCLISVYTFAQNGSSTVGKVSAAIQTQLNSTTDIANRSFNDNEQITTKYFLTYGDKGGATYIIRPDSIAGYTGSGVIKTADGKYAILQPTDGYYNAAAFNTLQEGVNFGNIKLVKNITTDTATLVPSNRIIDGQGFEVNQLKWGRATFDVYLADSVTIKNMRIVNHNAKVSLGGGSYRYGAENSHICGIYTNGSYNKFENLYIEGFTTGIKMDGYDPGSGTSDDQQYNNIIRNCEFQRVDFGILAGTQTGMRISEITGSYQELTSGYLAPPHLIYIANASSVNKDLRISNVSGYGTSDVSGSVLKITQSNGVSAFDISGDSVDQVLEIGYSQNVMVDGIDLSKGQRSFMIVGTQPTDSNLVVRNIRMDMDTMWARPIRVNNGSSHLLENVYAIIEDRQPSPDIPVVGIEANDVIVNNVEVIQKNNVGLLISLDGDNIKATNITGNCTRFYNLGGDNNYLSYDNTKLETTISSNDLGNYNLVKIEGSSIDSITTTGVKAIWPYQYPMYYVNLPDGNTTQFRVNNPNSITKGQEFEIMFINSHTGNLDVVWDSVFVNTENLKLPLPGDSLTYRFKSFEKGFLTYMSDLSLKENISAEVTTTTTASKFEILPVNCSSSVVTVNPPSNPTMGDWFAISDSRGNANTFNITVDFTTATQNLHGSSQNWIMNVDNDYQKFLYINSTIGWIRVN